MPLLHPQMKCYLILRPFVEKTNNLIEFKQVNNTNNFSTQFWLCVLKKTKKVTFLKVIKVTLNMAPHQYLATQRFDSVLMAKKNRGFIDPSWPLEKVDRFIRAIYFPPFSAARLRLEVGGKFLVVKNQWAGFGLVLLACRPENEHRYIQNSHIKEKCT